MDMPRMQARESSQDMLVITLETVSCTSSSTVSRSHLISFSRPLPPVYLSWRWHGGRYTLWIRSGYWWCVGFSALKSESLAWRFTGEPSDVQNNFDRIDMFYKFRVPTWAQRSTQSTIPVNGEVLPCLIRHLKPHCKLSRYVSDKAESGAFIDDQLVGTNNITLNLNMPVQINKRTNGAIAITREPWTLPSNQRFNQTTTIGLRYPPAFTTTWSDRQNWILFYSGVPRLLET